MALFGWKKTGGDQGDGGQNGSGPAGTGGAGQVPHEPEKAAKFFSHAHAAHETGRYEYAMTLWLGGLRFEAASMSGTEGFLESARQYLAEAGTKRPSKEVAAAVSGKSDVDKYLGVLLDWAIRPMDGSTGVRALDLAASLGLAEPAYLIGESVLGAALQDKKPRKDVLVKIMDSFSKIGALDRALKAGEAAYRLDPSDGNLGAHIRNLAAQATMNRGGYNQTGESGGFRANIRDAERQRQLQDSERIVKTEEVKDRVLADCEAEFKKRPEDAPTLRRLVKALIDRGQPQDEARALELLDEAFVRTKQYEFRAAAGEIRLRRMRRPVRELEARLEANPGDQALKDQLQAAQLAYIEADVAELTAKAEAYPTDLTIKYELGKRYYKLGKYWEAIEQLQEAQNDAKNRADALRYMAHAFLEVDYVDESIETFRKAIDSKDLVPAALMELRYGLLTALQKRAETTRDLAAAEEADRLASSIAVQQITYKDIRVRREALKKLVIELKSKPG